MLLRRWVVVLIIILMGVPATTYAQEQEQPLTHVVQPGENLFRIALRYGVSVDAIAQANNISDSRRIFSGQTLIIPGLQVPDSSPEVTNPLVAGTPVTHVVQRGESLTIIAQRYQTTVSQILEANNITNANRIFPGQALNIWTAETPVPSEAAPAPAVEVPQEAAVPTETQVYVVQRGEHLSQIANRFGLDWRVLAQMNEVTDPNRVYAGQELRIPLMNAQGQVIDMGILSSPAFNAPAPTVTQGKQIIIDLSDSRVYAYENGQLVRSVLVSTGRAATPTVTGSYNIYRRVRSQTMSGPGYSLPNVEWVLYFYQGYAIHGTYWHANWGTPMSHGCVNMPNEEARWFYENFGEIGLPVLVIP
ncbi:MAG: LysM peptidoglycan-binding domain-containing protein [Chloroflexota bacterium]